MSNNHGADFPSCLNTKNTQAEASMTTPVLVRALVTTRRIQADSAGLVYPEALTSPSPTGGVTLNSALEHVAAVFGHTPAICRGHYLRPRIVGHFAAGHLRVPVPSLARGHCASGLTSVEQHLVTLRP